jgi:hypothetical protein
MTNGKTEERSGASGEGLAQAAGDAAMRGGSRGMGLAQRSQLLPGAGGGTEAQQSELPGVTYEGQVVGTWDGILDSTLTAGARSGPGFSDKEVAIAYAKSLKGSVIIRHQQWFLVHQLDDGSMYDFERDNIKQMSGSKHVWSNITKEGSKVPGVVAFVTEDGWPIEAKLAGRKDSVATRYHQRTQTVPGRFGLVKFVERPDKLPENVLAPYRQGALDNAEGNDEQYLRGFYNAMRDLALDTLNTSEGEVRAERPKFAGKDVPDGATMNEVARLLVDQGRAD